MKNLINATAALLLGLLIVCAPTGRRAVAQFIMFPDEMMLWVFGATETPGEKASIKVRNLRLILSHYAHAVHGLREGDKDEFRIYHVYLNNAQYDFEFPKDVRDLAKRLMSFLPNRYVPGFAFRREDGTVAADPDRFIRYQLIREREAIRDSAGEGGED